MNLFVFHVDNPVGENHGYYRVGRDLDRNGDARSFTAVKTIPGWFGSANQGADIAIADIDDDGLDDLVALHIDNPGGENHGYYRVGYGLTASGNLRWGWSDLLAIPGWFGAEDQGAGLAVADLDRNGSPDLLVFHIDNPGGENHGYYRVGWDLDASGEALSWSEPIMIPGWFGSENQGGAIAVGDIDRNQRLDLLVFHIDNPQGENRGYYRIGWNLNAHGNASRWSNVKTVPGWFGSENQGAGVALGDVNRDGWLDLLAFHIDNPGGENHGYYRVGYGLNTAGDLTRGWTSPKLVAGWFGSENQGAGIAITP
ncbi:FG-GAP-like repeat-containing protein [Chondromyces apiculatus]|nr:FG-GAP-like repeat-containing protein [Chondromyces apiculatus]